ncbi:MAG: hypothetical protein NC429_17520 [Lachnospiraceae bacterium]|nr:hypothetical protein [Lachnospiraceae bacterium]
MGEENKRNRKSEKSERNKSRNEEGQRNKENRRNEVKEQRNYKDTVFRMLFRDRKRALSLYNGIHGTDYRDDSLLVFNTLENAIYMNLHNDISFVMVNTVQMYEHQSTLPVNLPLRDLLYIADILQKMVMDKTIYSSRRVKIPSPEFIVFYNGMEKMPGQMELKLSDSFMVPTENPKLELKVTVLNINEGMNGELKEKCPALGEYMQYVDRVRKYHKEMPLKDAVERAVDECIREGILSEFLMEQKAEVVKVSIYEFDEEREMRLIREDEREIGRASGEQRILMLNKILLADNRFDDLKRAVEDESYRKTLFEEYSIC